MSRRIDGIEGIQENLDRALSFECGLNGGHNRFIRDQMLLPMLPDIEFEFPTFLVVGAEA
jgi:hypothetical protein